MAKLILAQAETLKFLGEDFDTADIVFSIACLAGVVSLTAWLLRTSLGTKALQNTVPRPNRMPFFMPFIPLMIYFLLMSVSTLAIEQFIPDSDETTNVFLKNLAGSAVALIAIASVIYIAKTNFAGGLKGFGLNPKTIGQDLCPAALNLITILPVLLAVIVLTTLAGRLLSGQDFQMEKHEALKTLLTYPHWQIKLIMIAFAVLFAPVLEEMIFRGLFQSLLRSVFPNPWISILVAAAIFASFHANVSHWPVLFALGTAMGYAYEKSGSLLRAVFIHAAFNASSIFAALQL